MSDLTVESFRGSVGESVHRVSAVVAHPDGRRVAGTGDPRFPTFLRSAAKPFQAMPSVADGAAAAFALTSEELALACASHNSETRQVAIVRGLLGRIGCTEEHLHCGPHRSLAIELGIRLPGEKPPADLVSPGRLASNCSGKHALMLALARQHGWPVEGYEHPEHAVQARCRDSMLRWSGARPGEMDEAVDGCGVVSFRLPLERMAVAFSRRSVQHCLVRTSYVNDRAGIWPQTG